jgi:hypothetical protein
VDAQELIQARDSQVEILVGFNTHFTDEIEEVNVTVDEESA